MTKSGMIHSVCGLSLLISLFSAAGFAGGFLRPPVRTLPRLGPISAPPVVVCVNGAMGVQRSDGSIAEAVSANGRPILCGSPPESTPPNCSPDYGGIKYCAQAITCYNGYYYTNGCHDELYEPKGELMPCGK